MERLASDTINEAIRSIDLIESETLRSSLQVICNNSLEGLREDINAYYDKQGNSSNEVKVPLAIIEWDDDSENVNSVTDEISNKVQQASDQLMALRAGLYPETKYTESIFDNEKLLRIKDHLKDDCRDVIFRYLMTIKDEADKLNDLEKFGDIKNKVEEIIRKSGRFSGSGLYVLDSQSKLDDKLDYFHADWRDCILDSIGKNISDVGRRNDIHDSIEVFLNDQDLHFEDIIDANIYVNLMNIWFTLQGKTLEGVFATLTSPSFILTTGLGVASFAGIKGINDAVDHVSDVIKDTLPNLVEKNQILHTIAEKQEGFEDTARSVADFGSKLFGNGLKETVNRGLESVNLRKAAKDISEKANDNFLNFVTKPVEHITLGLTTLGAISLIISAARMASNIQEKRTAYIKDIRNEIVKQIKASVDVNTKIDLVDARIDAFCAEYMNSAVAMIKDKAPKQRDLNQLNRIIDNITQINKQLTYE